MVVIEIPSAITTIHPIISIVVGFILGIFSTPLSNWVLSKNQEYCTFVVDTFSNSMWNRYEHVRHVVTVTKRFGKTTNINCPNFKSKNTKIKKHSGKKYLSCKFGESFDPEIEDKRCPFYN